VPSTSLVFEGGTIRTLDPAAPVVERLAVTDGLIAETPAPDARRVDLQGGCALPGFNDAHVHFPTWALAQRQIRLEGADSLAEAVGRVVDGLAGAPPGAWMRGLGWRDAHWTEPPSRAALDAIAPDTPVILTSKDYHSLWLNSAALARAGGDLDAPGGVVERDANGEPTGILR
jgi:predicted amidohydrolase YtcJ